MKWIVLSLVIVCALPLSASAGREIHKRPGKDSRALVVTLLAPTQAEAPGAIPVEVMIEGRNEISKVFISLDGVIAAGRVDPPWEFLVTPETLPVEVCAVADDDKGKSARDCQLVSGPEYPVCFGHTNCDDGEYCYTPIGVCGGTGLCSPPSDFCPTDVPLACGCDGITYNNTCEARRIGVNVEGPGRCVGTGQPSPSQSSGPSPATPR